MSLLNRWNRSGGEIIGELDEVRKNGPFVTIQNEVNSVSELISFQWRLFYSTLLVKHNDVSSPLQWSRSEWYIVLEEEYEWTRVLGKKLSQSSVDNSCTHVVTHNSAK